MRTRFDQMPCYTFRVPEQHNHSDCGLYMLKFIEVIATRLDELQSPIWELRDWKKHPALMGKSVSHTAHLPHTFSTRFPHPFSTPVFHTRFPHIPHPMFPDICSLDDSSQLDHLGSAQRSSTRCDISWRRRS